MIIGYTNGYFDLLHIGHLSTLQKARALCDKLIVGVISDEECVKNKDRIPIMPLDQRLQVVQSLQCVDIAVPVYNDSKLSEWGHYKFNKLFVGSDHYKEEVWKMWEKMLKNCCDIIYLPYIKDVSDTLIKQRIIDEHNSISH